MLHQEDFKARILKRLCICSRNEKDQNIAKFDTAIPCHMQSSNRIPQKYANGLFRKLCKFAEAYDKVTLNKVFFEAADIIIGQSLQYHLA